MEQPKALHCESCAPYNGLRYPARHLKGSSCTAMQYDWCNCDHCKAWRAYDLEAAQAGEFRVVVLRGN